MIILLLINIYFKLIIHFNYLFIVHFHTVENLFSGAGAGAGARAGAGAGEQLRGEYIGDRRSMLLTGEFTTSDY